MATVIPIKDVTRPLNTFPIALVTIITLNILVFFAELVLGDPFIERYSMVPNDIIHGQHLETLITSMFLHASWLHIGGNMIFLWVFGDELEANYLGSLRFPILYLLCGLAADALQIAVDPTSTVPNLGASGAIAGVMGLHGGLSTRRDPLPHREPGWDLPCSYHSVDFDWDLVLDPTD